MRGAGGMEVHLLGGFQLRRDGEALAPIPSRAARSLLAHLVVNRGVRIPRERLASQLWPELPEARARRRLSHTLWQIQDALSEAAEGLDHLEVTSDSLSIRQDAPWWVDVQAFERGLDDLRVRHDQGRPRGQDLAELEAIVELYRGDFLAGHYDEWVLEEQQRLEQRYLSALGWLIELARSQGAYDQALTYARRLTNQDPLREEAHREVMRLSTLLGRTSDALRQYERCREVLANELGAAPSTATEQLHQRIQLQRQRGGDVPTAPTPEPFPDRIPLLGRDDERHDAIGALEAALGGGGGVALIEGEAGAGKSRFLAELVDDADWRGFQVLRASARGPEVDAPYATVKQLLAPALTPLRVAQLLPRVQPLWLSLVGQLVPAVVPALPPDLRSPPPVRQEEGAQRLRHALVEIVTALAELEPLLVVVDDLQWVDDASLEVLRAAAVAARGRRAALFLSYRGEEARARSGLWDVIRTIDRQPGTIRLRLGPLDADSVAELVRTVGRARGLEPGIASRLQRETGGNALFVVETLRALADALAETGTEPGADPGGDADAPGPGGGADWPVARSIRELVLGRLASLSSESRTVLELAATGGDATDLATIETASELPREVVADAAGLLVRRSLLCEQDHGGLGLHHDQIRHVVLDSLAPGAAVALHRRLGEALEQHAPDATGRLAHHFAAAGVTRKAVRYLRLAGRQAAAVHAYTEADGYLSRAVALQRTRPVSLAARFELVADHESVLDVLGDRERQRLAVAELATSASGDPALQAEAFRRQATVAAHLGDLGEARRLAERARELAAGPGATFPEVLLTLARIDAWSGRRQAAIDLLTEAVERHAPPPALEIELRRTLGSALRELQRYEEAAAELTRSLALAGEQGELREEAEALGVLGTVRMETGDSAQAVVLYGQAIDRCRALGLRRAEGVHLVNQANARYARGEVADALEGYTRAADIFALVGDRRGEAVVRLNLGFVCHAVLGDELRATEEVGAAERYFREVGDVPFEAACLDARAGVALRGGDIALAGELVAHGLALDGIGDHAWARCQLLVRGAEIALAGGALVDADRSAEEALGLVRRHHLADVEPALLSLIGTIRLAAGDVSDALARTGAAVAALDGGTERSYLIHLRRHDALRAAGRETEATQAVVRAIEVLEATLSGLSVDVREVAERIPEHRRILLGSPTADVVRVSVAAASAPSGRPLRPVEQIEVSIDLAPTDDTPEDPIQRRRHLLRRAVDRIADAGGVATVTDLARVLGVSEATVRRDLQALRTAGETVETRGRRAVGNR